MFLLLFVVELVLLMLFKRSILGGSPGAVVKAVAEKVGDRGFEPHSDLQVYKKQKFRSRSLVMIQYCGEPP